jgi:K(+)-stimulated pyrophosphate-energized sodium pump
MRTWLARIAYLGCRFAKMSAAITALLSVCAAGALAQPASEAGGEASLKLPDLSSVEFLGVDGHKLLLIGIIFCVLGLLFGLAI